MSYWIASLALHSSFTPPLLQPTILSVHPSRSTIPCYELLDTDIDLRADYTNPFDPEDVALDATVKPPNGPAFTVPGYLDQPFGRGEEGGKEVLTPSGPTRWRLRIAAPKPGRYGVTVRLRDRHGSSERRFSFESTAPIRQGFARVSRRDPRFFETTDGKSFYPIGENLCWSGAGGTRDYDRWLPALGKAHANYARLWLSPAWTPFALETPGRAENGKGIGRIDLANAWRLDYVLRLADRYGIRLLLTIDSFNILRDRDGYPYWDETPHNAKNGGPLLRMDQFWTDPTMAKLYRNKLRYLVARYGAMRSVFAWEFWNEVDVIRDFRAEPVRSWHIEMARWLAATDPYRHPITTSVGESAGNPRIDLAPGIDFVQTHHYSSPDLAGMVVRQQDRKSAWGKPHLIGEIGADVSGDAHADLDRKGYQAHDPIWASIATGCAATAQPWFWDSLIEPNNLYSLFASAAAFVHGVDFPAESFRRTNPTLRFADPRSRTRADLTVIGEPAVWAADPLNRPQTRRVQNARLIGGPVSEMQHGTGNHPDWHNPITFRLKADKSFSFEVEVSRVSGHGGATLDVLLDGKKLLRRPFADPSVQDTSDMNQYNGTYRVNVPAGSHSLVVENTGTDWFAASYRFVGVGGLSSRPPIDSWAIAGRKNVLGWARVSGQTWPRLVLYKNAPTHAPASVLVLNGIASGTYDVTLWNTWTGTAIRHSRATAIRGQVQVPLPAIDGDLAYRLTKKG